MKAYFYYGPYKENWKSKAFVLNTIKAQGIVGNPNFARLGPGDYQFSAGEALYFYGGRTALLKALERAQPDAWTMQDYNNCVMVVYRCAVAAKLKKKQFIVVSCVLAKDQASQIQAATNSNSNGNDGIYVTTSDYRYRKGDLEELIRTIPD